MKLIIRIPVSDQYVRVDQSTGKASFTRHMGEATRMDAAEAKRVLAALPHSLGARKVEVRN